MGSIDALARAVTPRREREASGIELQDPSRTIPREILGLEDWVLCKCVYLNRALERRNWPGYIRDGLVSQGEYGNSNLNYNLWNRVCMYVCMSVTKKCHEISFLMTIYGSLSRNIWIRQKFHVHLYTNNA